MGKQTYHILVSPAAKKDLRKIYKFSIDNWGNKKADNYLNGIKGAFSSISANPKVGVNRDDLIQGIKVFQIESHLVYYQIKLSNIEVVRILHMKQDPEANLCR